MGTNYYYHPGGRCYACGRSDDHIHIGKSSAGWVFSLHVYPDDEDDRPSTWVDWLKLFAAPEAAITDEYGRDISVSAMVEIVTERGRDGLFEFKSQWLAENHAIEGPRGLARHMIDFAHCIGHGDGTWDLMIGDFC